MKKYIKNLFVFVCICTVITLLLATTNYFTVPIIEQNQIASTNKSLKEVMPKGENFEKIDTSNLTLPSSISEAYKETDGKGYVVKMVTSGYGNNMIIMCGVDTEGIVTGAVCLSSNETLSKEKTYGKNFISKNAQNIDEVDTIAGATKTTKAYKNAVKDALKAVKELSGGER
ncbi:MAG: FMN-binding protein [Clostridia bacterium]|nr:FMN-binding protein [Clostridia bacterium]